MSYAIFSPEMKSYAAKKIHELFINLKKKTLYSNNKYEAYQLGSMEQ